VGENEIKPTQVDPEAKKIDSVLKLGVTMVGISGLIFATTSWDVISDLMKVFALIIMAILFFGLSKFSEIKLKLKNTTITYWILSMLFFVLAFLSAGYFKLFGDYFSLFGEGRKLFSTVLWILFSGVSFLSYYNRFKYDTFLYGAITSIFLALTSFLSHIGLEVQEILIIHVLLFIIINLFHNSENRLIYCLNEFSIIFSLVLGVFIAPIVLIKDSGITSLILRIVTLINL
jgi:hypothetical protein